MNNVKKDDKQRIIMENKGIKNGIVRRQTKQIIRQSKAKLNNAGDNEESEQKGDNYAVGQIEKNGKKVGRTIANRSHFQIKEQFKNLISKRKIKENKKDVEKIFAEIELNNAVNIVKNKQKIKKNTAVLFQDGSIFHKRKIHVKAKLLAEKVKFKAKNINQPLKAEQKKEVIQENFIRQKRKEMLTDYLFEQKTKIQGRKFVRNREQIEKLIAALKKAVTVKTVSVLGVIAAVIMLAALAGGATAVVKTPFGVFYSGVDGYENSIAKAIAEIDAEFEKKKEEDLIAENQRLRAENDYLKNLYALVLEEERRQNKKLWQFKN